MPNFSVSLAELTIPAAEVDFLVETLHAAFAQVEEDTA